MAVAEIEGRRQHLLQHLPDLLCTLALEDERQDKGKFVTFRTGDRRPSGAQAFRR